MLNFRELNPLNPELNLICYLLALLGAHRFLHVNRIRVNILHICTDRWDVPVDIPVQYKITVYYAAQCVYARWELQFTVQVAMFIVRIRTPAVTRCVLDPVL